MKSAISIKFADMKGKSLCLIESDSVQTQDVHTITILFHNKICRNLELYRILCSTSRFTMDKAGRVIVINEAMNYNLMKSSFVLLFAEYAETELLNLIG